MGRSGLAQQSLIRVAQQSDIYTLSAFAVTTYTAAFGHSFSASDLAAHLEKNLSPDRFAQILQEDIVLLAEVGDSLVGYVQFGPVNPTTIPNTDHELRRLYVRADCQNQGYGSALLEAALSHPQMAKAPSIYLDVWEHNPAAQRLYRRYGFDVIGTRTFDVASGSETSLDLIMVRHSPEK